MSGSRVRIPVNGREIDAYLSPAAGGTGPGVIVIQEWWGLVPHIEELCDRYASQGFTALSPDLYHGESTKSPDEAGKLMMALEIDETEKDLRSAVGFLLAHSACTSQTVGTVGFCMGGMLSLFAAGASPNEVSACIDYYGIHPNVHPDFAAMRAPVLGFFGAQDPMVTPDTVAALETTIRAAGREVEFHSYEDAGHAFFNDTRPDAYHAESAADTWKRAIEFFRTHVK
ncbi:MAG: dienelactone hydrolase family protein [Candidatus Eisenbacteria bacterium]|nr:dienelactone hydrolase family protein [Candidatus Eisenbacteria bacterium]